MSSHSNVAEEIKDKFNQTLNEVKQRIDLSSYRCAEAFIVEFEGKIASVCIVFRFFDVDEKELYYDDVSQLRIYTKRMEINDASQFFNHYESEGVLEIDGKELAFSLNDLNPNYIKIESTDIDGWFTYLIKVETAKRLGDFYPDDTFRRLYSGIKFRDFKDLIRKRTNGFCEINDGHPTGIYFYFPVYAKIHRLGLVENKIKIWVKTVSGLINRSQLKLVCTYPDYRKNIPINELDLERCLDNFCFLKYEFDADNIDECKVELRLLNDVVSSKKLPIQDVMRWKEMLDKYLSIWNRIIKIIIKIWNQIIKDNWKKIVVLLLLTIVFSVLYFVFPTIFYGVLSFLRDAIEHFKLDYTLSVGSIASILSALATLFLVWISIRNLNLSLSMMWGDIAQEALRNFILSQEKLIHRIKEKINDDNLIDYNDISKLIKKLEPDPSIVYVIYDEHPKLRIELAKFIKTVLDYNVNIDPEYSENVKKRTENVLESLQKLKSKLYRKYAIYMPKYTYTS